MRQLTLNFQNDSEASGEMTTLSSPEASRNHVNRTRLREKDLAKKTTATSGRKCLDSFGKFAHVGSWAKTFMGLLIGQGDWYSKRSVLIWKLKATKFNRLYFQLLPLTRHTGEIEFGLSPTAQTQGLKVCEKIKSNPIDAAILPTPTAVQRDHPERVEALKATGAKTMMSRKNGEERPNSILDAAMFYDLLPTPLASDCGEKVTGKEKQDSLTKRSIELTGKTSQLNSQFVGEMMGFPKDWTLKPFLKSSEGR